MLSLPHRLLRTIRKRELLRAGDRVAVAVSGGADSVALLCLLEELRGELGIVLSVAHVNHKLRGAESDGDERFVAELAASSNLEFCAVDAPIVNSRGSGDMGEGKVAGVEAKARELRYEFFRNLARQGRVTKVATAHTMDDQAETVLLRIFRGTGIRGLAGVHPHIALQEGGRTFGEIVRPLLGFRRAELRAYLDARGQKWREDSSNENVAFLRNRVRQTLLPFIAEEFGEASIEHMAELAEIARAEEEWAVSTQYSVPSTQRTESAGAATGSGQQRGLERTTLEVRPLLALPLASARRLVRAWIETNAPEVAISFRLIEEILDLARGAVGKRIELPGASNCSDEGGTNAAPQTSRPKYARRGRRDLVLECDPTAADNYQYTLPVPGEIAIPELEARIEARIVDVQSVLDDERDMLLDPAHVGTKLTIRNWRAGDRYWPAHTASEKKVKDLLSDRHVTGTKKKLWPVAVVEDGSLVWIRGLAVPAAFWPPTTKGVLIRERL